MAVVYPMMTNADCRRCYKPHQLVDSHLASVGRVMGEGGNSDPRDESLTMIKDLAACGQGNNKCGRSKPIVEKQVPALRAGFIALGVGTF